MSIFPDSILTTDSPLCLSVADGRLSDTLKTNLATTNLTDQSLTTGRDIKSSFPDFYLEVQEEGGFVAFSREFLGAVGQGETAEEAIADIEEAIKLLKEVANEDKMLQQK